MQFAAAMSRHEDSQKAVAQLVASIQRQMPGPVHLLAVFLTTEYREDATEIAALLRYHLAPDVLIGCTGEGVISGDKEIEGEPAITILAGRLPGVALTPFAIGIEEWEDLLDENAPERLRRRVGAARGDTRAFLTLGDPFTTPIVEFMAALDALAPGAPTVGGMASGAQTAGQSLLLLDDGMREDGVVGVRIAGPVRVDTIVSQGCRPVGETLLVTRAENNLIHTLGGKPALDTARRTLSALSEPEQELVQNGLFLGIVINEYQPAFGRGDFLVRSVLGADEAAGVIALNETIRAGQTVQFHVRDAETADEDLRLLMAQAALDETAPAGGLVFSCNGRGIHLFDLPSHDVRAVLEAVPETPLAGFFAQGELGPIGGRSFIHGHTASIVLFRPEPASPE